MTLVQNLTCSSDVYDQEWGIWTPHPSPYLLPNQGYTSFCIVFVVIAGGFHALGESGEIFRGVSVALRLGYNDSVCWSNNNTHENIPLNGVNGIVCVYRPGCHRGAWHGTRNSEGGVTLFHSEVRFNVEH